MIKKVLAGAAAAGLMVGAAYAQDSTFGEESQDTISIEATVEPVVLVSGMPDTLNFTLGDAFFNQAGPNTTQRPMFCIYSNVTSLGSYSLSAIGTDAAGGNSNAWALTGAGGELPFNINVSDGVQSRQVGPGDNFSGFSTAARTGTRPNTADCSDTGDNTQIIVAFSKVDVLAANAGDYTGSITLVASAI